MDRRQKRRDAPHRTQLTYESYWFININMKYRLVHITVNGSHDYTLRVEERISVWSRFFFSVQPKMYVVHGTGYGDWHYGTYGITLPRDLIDFANEVISEYNLRLRK